MEEKAMAMLNIKNYHRVQMIQNILNNIGSYVSDVLDEIEASRDDEQLFPNNYIDEMIANVNKDMEVLKTYL